MTPPDEVVGLAAKLSERDRRRVINMTRGITRKYYSKAAIERLCDLGFARATSWSDRGITSAVSTPLGLTLRAHLTGGIHE